MFIGLPLFVIFFKMSNNYIKKLQYPTKSISRTKLIQDKNIIPDISGIYGWYFKDFPLTIPTKNCIKFNDYFLLYLGISPDKKGKPNSKGNLYKRIINHYCGNAYCSTLRLSLGVLLSKQSNFPLRRVGKSRPIGKKIRCTFTHKGEQWLDRWLEKNAFVFFIEHTEPWDLEKVLMKEISLPLNIQGNKHHPFSKSLSKIRSDARALARDGPIANEDNQIRNSKKIYFIK